MKVKGFGESLESPPLTRYYIDEHGNKIDCGEEIIDKIWHEWVSSIGVKRHWEGDILVYELPVVTDIII